MEGGAAAGGAAAGAPTPSPAAAAPALAPAAAAPALAPTEGASTSAPKPVTKEQLMTMMTGEKFKKKFLKQKCAECGVACMKTFAAGGPLIAKNCLDSFWCADCGRLLCSKHRSRQLHTCEAHNAGLAAKRVISQEQIAAELATLKANAEAEAERQRVEGIKAGLRKKEEAAVYFEMKRRREFVASKANTIASFIQGQARKFVTEGHRNREELGELWQLSTRHAVVLSNECHTPMTPGELNTEAWEECFGVYNRAVELANVVLAVEGERMAVSRPRQAVESAVDCTVGAVVREHF